MDNDFKLGVVLLAAGASRRFEGIKQLASLADPVSHTNSMLQTQPKLRGGFMLQSALNVLTELPAHKKLVTIGANKEDILAQIHLPDGVTMCDVPDWEEGIAASIRKGISTLQDCSHVLIMLADQPEIKLSDYTFLIDECRNNLQNIICACYEQKNAVPAIFPASYFGFLRELKGDKGAGKLLNTDTDMNVIAIPLQRGACDIDTQMDLAAWREQNKQKN